MARNHDGLLSFISLVLVAALILGLVSSLVASGYREPDNPIGKKAEVLKAEMLEGGGELLGNQEDQKGTTPPETLPPEEGTEPPSEPPTEPPTEPEETTQPEETTEETNPEDTQPDPTTGGEENPGTEPEDSADGSDSGQDGPGTGGDGGDGGEGGDDIGGGGDDSPGIFTDLKTRLITKEELPDGFLNFVAYPTGKGNNLTVKVILKNSQTGANGKTLTSADGIHYTAELAFNEKNTFLLLLKENGSNIAQAQYTISYEADKATQENPNVGKAPSIITNLEDWSADDLMETQDFIFWVSAKTHPDLGAKTITSDKIEVRLNGKVVPKETGDARPEYSLHFEPPNVGDYADYQVTVLVWDGYGNSAIRVYDFRYHTVSEGDSLGSVTLKLDATTVGLGIIDEAVYPIVQGDTVAGVVVKFLEDYGYEVTYDNSIAVGFYLRGISRGDLCRRAQVPEKLWTMILRDGIDLSGYSNRDSLSEYDYTMGSGWMYSINGSVYPGRGLSDYRLSSNTTIYIRFTLAYGKDIGGYDASGKGQGSLSSYCGLWINGGYQALDHDFRETDRQEATEEEAGFIRYTCTKCGEEKEEILPWEEPEDTEPTDPDPTDPEPTDPEPTDPEPTDPEPTDPEPTDPEPTDPEPTDPKPTDPEPTDPKPTAPEPTDPKPTEPEPTDPIPSDPEPGGEE